MVYAPYGGRLFGKEPEVVLHEIQHIIQKIEGFTGGASTEYWNGRMEEGYSKRGSNGMEMMPNELYWNTAGEIEARDTETRRKLSAEERRANAPARADENTVFTERSGGVSSTLFSEKAKMSNRQKEEDTIKRQITDNLDRLNLMKPVATIYDELNMGNSKGQYHK